MSSGTQGGRLTTHVLDTATGVLPSDAGERLRAADDATVEARSLLVLQRTD